jgi:UDP-N-acetylglucosamine transferase subunit ALG13
VAGSTKFNKVREKPLVLLSPLDWGLGHTTRCIPLIRELVRLQCEVIIACSPTQQKLLELEFQSLTFFIAPFSPPVYGRTKTSTIIRLLFQLPKILTLIKRENRWLRQFLRSNPVDAIISDNRFGLFAPGIPCIFITHQLNIKTGLGAVLDRLARRINYRYIKKFTACWVPDYEGENSMSGKLSNGAVHTISITRIGGLSRFENCNDDTRINANDPTLLMILSGPEPQRSILEKKLVNALKDYSGRAILVRGLPGIHELPEASAGVQVFNHLPATELNKLICGASIVVARCGYTTVMDLLKLKKKGILIPTPGQAEQEYLAKHLYKNKLVYTVTQHKFSLAKDILAAENFPSRQPDVSMEEYKLHLAKFVGSLRKV